MIDKESDRVLRRVGSFVLAVILAGAAGFFISWPLSLWFDPEYFRSPKPSEIVLLCGGIVLAIGLMAPIVRLVRHAFRRQH